MKEFILILICVSLLTNFGFSCVQKSINDINPKKSDEFKFHFDYLQNQNKIDEQTIFLVFYDKLENNTEDLNDKEYAYLSYYLNMVDNGIFTYNEGIGNFIYIYYEGNNKRNSIYGKLLSSLEYQDSEKILNSLFGILCLEFQIEEISFIEIKEKLTIFNTLNDSKLLKMYNSCMDKMNYN